MPTTTTLLPFLSAPCLATSASFLIAAARNSCFLPILRHGLKNSWERVKEGKKSVLYKFPKKSIPRFRILCRFLPVDAAFPPSFSPLLAFCGFFTLLLLLAAKNLCFSCKLAAAAAKTQARNRAWLGVGATMYVHTRFTSPCCHLLLFLGTHEGSTQPRRKRKERTEKFDMFVVETPFQSFCHTFSSFGRRQIPPHAPQNLFSVIHALCKAKERVASLAVEGERHSCSESDGGVTASAGAASCWRNGRKGWIFLSGQ